MNCLLCRQPIADHDQALVLLGEEAAHVTCNLVLEEAVARAMPVADVRPRRVVGVCSISYQDYASNWAQTPENVRKERYARYTTLLERTLDFQEKKIREYCQRACLPDPEIRRELPQIMSGRRLARITAVELGQGDHLVLASHATGISKGTVSAAYHSIRLAEMLAEKGAALHLAYYGLDLRRPLAQHVLRLADESVKVYNDVYQANLNAAETDQGFTTKLYGYTYDQITDHAMFKFVVRAIKGGASPAEVGRAAKNLWYVVASIQAANVVSFCPFVGKERAAAQEIARQRHYYCFACARVSRVAGRCPVCQSHQKPMNCFYHKGLRMHKQSDQPFAQVALAFWDWYCTNNPEQERRPWENSLASAS